MHWVLLVPVYFFGTISLFATFHIVARRLRLDVAAETLAARAGITVLVLLAVVFAAGLVTIEQVTIWSIAGLMAISFVLAALDVFVAPVLTDDRG
jgi:hypothetical protein